MTNSNETEQRRLYRVRRRTSGANFELEVLIVLKEQPTRYKVEPEINSFHLFISKEQIGTNYFFSEKEAFEQYLEYAKKGITNAETDLAERKQLVTNLENHIQENFV